MLETLLLVPPIAMVVLVAALARRLGRPERTMLVVSAALLAASALASPVAPVNDPWTHYEHLRAALLDPVRLLDPWDRPGFSLLAAGPAALGIRAARLAAIPVALVAIAAVMRAAPALSAPFLPRAWLAGALLVAQYDFFGQGASTMTELPFAAALAVAILGWAEDRPWVVAAGLGWIGITRPEGPAFVALGALAVLLRWRRLAPALAAAIPFVLYVAAGALAFGDVLWLATMNPYRGFVEVRVGAGEVARSYFFTALLLSQGPALALLETAGAVLAVCGVAPRLRFLLGPVLASFALLTFLRIGPNEQWRESRYLVTIAPALALLGAAAVEATLARFRRAAPPVLLAVSAVAAGWMTTYHWGQLGAWSAALLAALCAAGLGIATILWLARHRVSPALALCGMLVLPLVAVPPGILSRHRAEVGHRSPIVSGT